MTKHNYFRCILVELHIPLNGFFLSNGSTVTRAGLREVYKALDPNGPKNLLKHEVTKAILNNLGVVITPQHFSTGSTVTKMAIVDILEALLARNSYSMAA